MDEKQIAELLKVNFDPTYHPDNRGISETSLKCDELAKIIGNL
jgi:hypothetical protein